MSAKEGSAPAMAAEKPVYPFNKPPGPIQKPPGYVNNNQPKPKGQFYRAPFPARRQRGGRSRRNVCRCCCIWLILVVISLLLLLGIAGVVLYFMYRPQEPHFSVKMLQIPRLTVTTSKSGDTLLNTQVSVDIEAMNPNKAVTFFYEESKVSVVSMDKVSLVQGTYPAFFQGDQNTTKLKISNLKALNTAIDQTDGNNLKLKYTQNKLKVKVELDTHVKIKISKWKTGKIKITVKCDGVPAAKTTATEANTKCKLDLFNFKWFPFK